VFKRAHYVALGSVILLLVVLLNLPASSASRLKLAVSSLFLPLFGVVGAAPSAAERATYQFLPRQALVAELQRITLENQRLVLLNRQGDEALAENARLRAMYGSAPRGNWKPRVAHVVGREPSTWWRMVIIDLGTRDGLLVNQVVMTSDGLVGRVSLTGYGYSQVSLVGDAGCGVAVVCKENRELGIISGGQNLVAEGGLVEMMVLQTGPGVMAGYTLLTSGQGGVFPAGIPVGRVVDTRSSDNGSTVTARVRLSAGLNRLEEVWVLQPL
jgi:rod shape-determining protein MreC